MSFVNATSTTNEQAHFSPRRLADRWGVCELTLRRWRREGRIRAMRIGRSVRFAIEEIERIEREAQEVSR